MARFVACEFAWGELARFLDVEGVFIATSAMSAAMPHVAGCFISLVAGFAAGFAAIGLLPGNRMPESVE